MHTFLRIIGCYFMKKYGLLISDYCDEKGYSYKEDIAEFMNEVKKSRNPRKLKSKNIKLSPVTDCIKMNRTVGDECH